ncbi:hypothetical protein DUI70_4365 [Streptomyces albus]|nr:hypothetical protein DUI70_4365 [Streptomyces albus]
MQPRRGYGGGLRIGHLGSCGSAVRRAGPRTLSGPAERHLGNSP